MALRAGRSLLAAATRARPALAPLTRRPAAGAFSAFRQNTALVQAGARPYVTVMKYDRDEVLEQLDAFRATVYSTNWANYLDLVYDVPFWEAELEKLTTVVQPYLHEKEVGAKFGEVQEMMDVLYQCEDVRDHINELCDLSTRSSGLMGTGFLAGEQVENVQDNAKALAEAYDKLLEKHPDFKPKIEQTVGHGLAILRGKYKFKFGSMHRYFF